MNEIDVARLLEKKAYGYHKVENSQTYHFIIIGAGGTGGYLIPNLARMVSLKNKIARAENRPLHSVTIVDADEVKL